MKVTCGGFFFQIHLQAGIAHEYGAGLAHVLLQAPVELVEADHAGVGAFVSNRCFLANGHFRGFGGVEQLEGIDGAIGDVHRPQHCVIFLQRSSEIYKLFQ